MVRKDVEVEVAMIHQEPLQDDAEKWSDLLYEFTDATTLHGLRYVFMRSTWLLRRIIWFLVLTTAIVVFVYLNAQNIERFLSNPKKVNMDVSVKKNLPFPAVTICSYNCHKYSSVVDMGLFDSFYTLYEPKAREAVNGDWYHYRDDLCIYDKEILENITKCKTNLTEHPCSSEKLITKGFSSVVCEYTCTNYWWCTGFWYNRTSLTCTISATVLVEDLNLAIGNAIGEKNATPAIQVIKTGLCDKESAEYYTRKRKLDIPSFMCTFDLDDCPQIHNQTMRHTLDNFVIGKTTDPAKDYTIDSERGRYLYVHETNTRPGSSAFLITNDYAMRNSCLEFYYYFIGEGKTKLEVKLKGKSFDNVELGSVEGSEVAWKRFYKEIDDGDGSVELVMSRQKEENSFRTGIAIDNFAIQQCDKYKRNCLYDPKGITYEGNIAVTETGEACSNRSIRHPPTCQNSDHDVKPWCLTETYWMYCDIPHCECSDNEFWCSKSKRCIPARFACDGMDDCVDREDETDSLCRSKLTVSCSFRDKFICGYQSIVLNSDLAWRHTTAEELSSRHDPKEGQFMYVAADLASEGDRAILRSPAFTLHDTEQCLGFQLHSYNDGFGTFAQLEIVLVPENQLEYNNVTLKIISLRSYEKGWQYNEVKLPKNDGTNQKYYVDWIYTMGFPLKSNAALKYIYWRRCREKDDSTVSTEKLEKRRHISCTDFSNTSACPVQVTTDCATVVCGATSDSVFSSDMHGANYLLKEGTFQSPGYPDNTSATYVSERVVAHIMATNNSTILLNFYGFSLKSYSEDLCPQHLLIKTGENFQQPFNENRYCVTHEAEGAALSFQASYMDIVAVANYSSYPVFRGYYNVIPNEDAAPIDHSLACYKGHVTGFAKENKDILIITDPFYFDSPQCLSFMAASYFDTQFQVTLAGRQYVEIYKGNNLRVRLTIPPGSYRIKFLVAVPSYAGNEYILEIPYIETKLGLCAEIDIGGNVSCAFEWGDTCGYNDVSPGHTRWSAQRVPRELFVLTVYYGTGTHGMLLEYAASRKSPMKGYLLSPWFEVESTACISISVLSAYKTVIQIYTLRSLDVLKSHALVEYTGVILEGQLPLSTEIEVASVHHYIMFGIEAEDTNKIFIMDVTFTDGICNQPQNISEKTWNVGYQDFIMDMERQISEVAIIETKPTSKPPSMRDSIELFTSLKNEMSDWRHHRRNYTAYFTVDDVFEQTAHELEDLIFSCEYNEKQCDFSKDFLRQRTEMGICYTFNPGGDRPLKYVTTPGSTNGLRLVMNSEAYDMTKGYSTDSGVKVHVHDQDEIPYVHLVGLAVALSHHTYFAITMKEFKSLGAPYGNCGNKDLDLFQKENYTRFRCNSQCTTRQWETTCNCRTHYMRGDYEYCSFQDYIRCYDSIEKNGSNSCDCPTACHIKSFSTQSSMSSLSPLGMSELLLQTDKIKKIKEKYHRILDYDHWMLPEDSVNIWRQIDEVVESTDSLAFFIDARNNGDRNSRFMLLQMALKKLYVIVFEDLRLVNPILEEIKTSEQCYNSTATARMKVLQSIVDNLDYVVLMQEVGVVDHPELLENIKSANRSIETMAAMARKACMTHSENLERRFVLPDGLNYQEVYTVGESLRHLELEEASENLGSVLRMKNEDFGKETTKKLLKQTLAFFKDLLKEPEIYDVQFWSVLDAALAISTKLELYEMKHDSTSKNVEDELLRSVHRLKYYSVYFLKECQTRRTTITDLALLLADMKFADVQKTFRRFMSQMENEAITVLLSEINYKGPKHLYHIYMDALNLYSRITQYTKSDVTDKITSAVKNMTIWKHPTVKLDDVDLIDFTHTLEEARSTFRLPLRAFYELKAPGLIQKLLSLLFGVLASDVDGMVQNYLHVFQDLEKSFVKLNNSIQDILKATTIDPEFIVKNFLRLDVFYDELTHEIVEQTPAYELTQVFSDLGGYLGLLVGASVITICEFLDLVFHYAFVRCKNSLANKEGN